MRLSPRYFRAPGFGTRCGWGSRPRWISEDEDCNDYDEGVYPGAPEEWNAVDDDCNGRVDADGSYDGNVDVIGQVIIEGIAYNFGLVCPASVMRDSATLS